MGLAVRVSFLGEETAEAHFREEAQHTPGQGTAVEAAEGLTE